MASERNLVLNKRKVYMLKNEKLRVEIIWLHHNVIATTCWNGTHSLLTSAKLLTGYLVVGITKELDKELSLHCYPIYINYM